ncbi:hypothetical protein OAU26_08530, partial [Mariniblastus sp.]|nr:hypothetical protein [Mariniblastus sp.]
SAALVRDFRFFLTGAFFSSSAPVSTFLVAVEADFLVAFFLVVAFLAGAFLTAALVALAFFLAIFIRL